MRLSWKREILALGLLAAMVVIAIHYYSVLPERIPEHLNAQGKPDEWSGKVEFFLMWGAYLVVPYLLITLLPFFDPFRHKIGEKFRVLLFIRDLLLVTIGILFLVNIALAAQGRFGFDWLGMAIGMFLIIGGNYLPKVPRNWSFGVKNPWALSSESVWKKTQILGGWLLAAVGMTFIIFALSGLDISIPVLAVIPVMIIIRIYSYTTYKKLEKGQGTGTHAL